MSKTEFNTILDPLLKDRICNHLKEHKYEYLDIIPNGDYPILDDPPLSLAVYTSTVCRDDQVTELWIIAGGFLCTYNVTSYPKLSDALNYHVGMLVNRGFFTIVPTEKVVVE